MRTHPAEEPPDRQNRIAPTKRDRLNPRAREFFFESPATRCQPQHDWVELVGAETSRCTEHDSLGAANLKPRQKERYSDAVFDVAHNPMIT
jgi:hypothetical protein